MVGVGMMVVCGMCFVVLVYIGYVLLIFRFVSWNSVCSVCG